MNCAIDLFSGAGGLSLGLKMAGWKVSAAIEYDAVAIETHRLNFPRTLHDCSDIRDVDFTQYRGEIDLVAGGPPCQPFSVSGKQLGNDDARDMVPEFVRAVREIKPRAFVMENVHGLATARFLPYLEKKLYQLQALGYSVFWQVLNSAEFGIPQRRQRLFVVGFRGNTDFKFPRTTHGGASRTPYHTVRQALKGCPRDEPNAAKVVYAKNPILRRSPYAGMLLNGKGRPLNLDAPSHTIPATAGGNRTHIIDLTGVLKKYHGHLMRGGKPRKGEVEGCRRITVRESARLQTFPDNFNFVGSKNQRYMQIGNAVPPDFARIVLEQVRRVLEPKRSNRSRTNREVIDNAAIA